MCFSMDRRMLIFEKALEHKLKGTLYPWQNLSQETDSAIYQCQVLISLSDKVRADVALVVRQPPIISDNSTRSV